MSIYEYTIREHNGEQEYSQTSYVEAPNLRAAQAYAHAMEKDWYDGAKKCSFGGYETDQGYPVWKLISVRPAEPVRVDVPGTNMPKHIPLLTELYVLQIHHSHGDDVSLHVSKDAAYKALAAYCRAWWEDEHVPGPMPKRDRALCLKYFTNVANEYATIDKQPIQLEAQ